MQSIEVYDPKFKNFVMFNAPLQKLASGFDWAEGPVWFGDAACLLFSDIPNNRIMRWSVYDAPQIINMDDGDERVKRGHLSTYRSPSHYANGHCRDRQGRLISCEHGKRRVTRTEYNGSITVIADEFLGKPLNSPNDVVVKSDGTIWFSDPHYGIMTHYEGHQASQELPCNLYRVDPERGTMDAVATDFNCPNGLCFSPREDYLYVSDTGRMFHDDAQDIRRFTVNGDGQLSADTIFHTIDTGCADGMRVDTEGFLWSSAGDGVHCINAEGALMGKIRVPEIVSNLCFGGRANHQLFITATTGLYSIALNRQGAV